MYDKVIRTERDSPMPRVCSEVGFAEKRLWRVETTALLGLVHDFNHILNIIRGYNELLLTVQVDGSGARDKLLQIRRAVDQGAALTRQLLKFSRGEAPEATLLNVNDLISELREYFQRLLGHGIELRLLLDSRVSPVRFDPGQLQQVLMNLVVNAGDAMPDGGCLTIKTTGPEVDKSAARLRHYVLVEVIDTGCGIAPEMRSRIFEPFFTTKETRGTGLGLANVREIVFRSGGHVCLESEPGRGSNFQVFLPCATDEPTR